MRILMVTANLPYPPQSGGALRGYGLLKGLHDAGHAVTLLSFADGTIDLDTTPLPNLCEQVETVPMPHRATTDRLRDIVTTQQPDIARRLDTDAMHTALSERLRALQYELVQFEGIEVANYLFTAKATQPAIITVYDAFNAEAALQRRIAQVDRSNPRRWPAAAYSMIQAGRIEGFERRLGDVADAVIAVSAEDADELRQYRDDNCVYVVPNGIFTEGYQPEDSASSVELGSNALVFTGKMDYRPNVDAVLWFADAVLPSIREQVPNAVFYIVGQKPHPRLDVLRGRDGVAITGWVPGVLPYLQAAAVFVAPLRMGSGTRLKLLEAMAAGCAVVGTEVAASGLQSVTGFRTADDANSMAAAVIHLLQNPDERAALREQAQAYVRQHYDWRVLVPKLLDVYQDIGLG